VHETQQLQPSIMSAMRKLALKIIFIFLVFARRVPAQAFAPILLSEIMINPTVGKDKGTWFEFYNPGPPFDLSDLYFLLGNYNASTSHDGVPGRQVKAYRIPKGIVIPSKWYFVFGNNKNRATNGNVIVDLQYDFHLDMNETYGIVAVVAVSNVTEPPVYPVIAGTAWGAALGALDPPFEAGASMSLKDEASVNVPNITVITMDKWCVSVTPYTGGPSGAKGTPRAANRCTLPPPTKSPILAPTNFPVKAPTKSPVKAPTKSPATAPTKSPATAPTKSPVSAPATSPVVAPSPARPFAQIVLSELMINPTVGKDKGTWFEFYNPNRPFDLSDHFFVLGNYNASASYDGVPGRQIKWYRIPSGTSIPAGRHFIFGNNKNPSTNGNVEVDLQYDFHLDMNETYGLVGVAGPNSNFTSPPNISVVVAVAWGAGLGFPNPPFEAGASLNFKNATSTRVPDITVIALADWCVSVTPYVGGPKGAKGTLNAANKCTLPSPTTISDPAPSKPPTKRPTRIPTRAPSKTPTTAPARKRCGLLGWRIFCPLTRCGILGRLLRLCKK
jgi:hypothetical protein